MHDNELVQEFLEKNTCFSNIKITSIKPLDDKYYLTNISLGRGSFGEVFLAALKEKMKDEIQLAAAKLINYKDEQYESFVLNRENWILAELCKQNPENIVRMFGIFQIKSAHQIYIFLEYCDGGTLQRKMKKQKYFSEKEVLSYFQQISSAFKAIGQIKCIHRDLKPENILFKQGILKVTDFGFARVVNQRPGYYTRAGTLHYMSPQIINNHQFSEKCDIWSLGIIMYQLLYGKHPWISKQIPGVVELAKLYKKKALTFPETPEISSQTIDLIRQMLQINENFRISWDEIYKHPLNLTSIKFEIQSSQNQINPLINNADQNKQMIDLIENELYKIVEFKIIIIGDKSVGKTQFVQYLTGTSEPDQYAIYKKKILSKNQLIRLNFHDMLPGDNIRNLPKIFFRNAQAVVFVFNCLDLDSFDRFKGQINEPNQKDQLENGSWKYIIEQQLDPQIAKFVYASNMPLIDKDSIEYEQINTYVRPYFQKRNYIYLDQQMLSQKERNAVCVEIYRGLCRYKGKNNRNQGSSKLSSKNLNQLSNCWIKSKIQKYCQ